MWLMRNHTKSTLLYIAAVCGVNDHSTVINGLKKVDDSMEFSFDTTFAWLKQFNPEKNYIAEPILERVAVKRRKPCREAFMRESWESMEVCG